MTYYEKMVINGRQKMKKGKKEAVAPLLQI
jgi:hypothetical protein